MKTLIKSVLLGFVLLFVLFAAIVLIAVFGGLLLALKIIGIMVYVLIAIAVLWAAAMLIHSGIFLYKYNKRNKNE